MGPLRFELKSQDPQPCRMDQATLRPRRVEFAFSMAILGLLAIVNYCNQICCINVCRYGHGISVLYSYFYQVIVTRISYPHFFICPSFLAQDSRKPGPEGLFRRLFARRTLWIKVMWERIAMITIAQLKRPVRAPKARMSILSVRSATPTLSFRQPADSALARV